MRSVIVCDENAVNEWDDIQVSSGGASKGYIYDQNPDSKWSSDGSAEGGDETLEITFKNRLGATTSKTFDRIILLGANLSRFYFEYWDGAAWQQIAESVFGAGTENAAENLLIEIGTPITAEKVKLTASYTIGAVAEKQVGELKVCEHQTDLRHLVNIERMDADDSHEYRLQGGGLVSGLQWRKFEASLKVRDLTLTTWTILRALLRSRDFLTLILNYDHDASEIFEVMPSGQPSEMLDRKTGLYEVNFQVKER